MSTAPQKTNGIQVADIVRLLEAQDLPAERADSIVRYLVDELNLQDKVKKDTMPAAGRPSTGYIYEHGPWSLIGDSVISMSIGPGSDLVQWLPTETTTARQENHKHLEWVGPKDFDGSDTYDVFLASVDIAECGYGPSTQWSGFEYSQSGGTWSWTTDMMKRFQDGFRYWETQPMYTVRGDAGMQLGSDADWAIARTLLVLQHHYNYVMTNGSIANSMMETDGMDRVLTQGYVQARKIGSGVPHWADPLTVNAAGVTTAAGVLSNIRYLYRMLNRRFSQRNVMVSFEDRAVAMGPTMWAQIAEALAQGQMYNFPTGANLTYQMNWGDFIQNYQNILRRRRLPIEDGEIQVILDDNLETNVTITSTNPDSAGIAGNVYMLTKRANGMNILAQRLFDWQNAQVDNMRVDEDYISLQGGLARAVMVEEAKKCFYYAVEQGGMFVSRMQPFQGVVRNVVIPTLFDNEHEAGSFTSPDWFVYNGQQAGGGSGLITPV